MCIIYLPPDYGISSTFNILDLIKCKESTLISSDPFEPVPFFESDPPLLVHKPNCKKKHDVIDHILDEQIKSFRGQNCQLFDSLAGQARVKGFLDYSRRATEDPDQFEYL